MDKKCDLCLWNQGSGGGGGGGSSTLSGLTDVDISNPSNGQTLVYNATSGKWENGAGGGGGALVVRGVTVGEKVTLDHTYAEIVSAAPLVYYASEPAPNRTSFMPLKSFGAVDELYVVQFGNEDLFSTDSEDGYPVSRGIN